MRFGGKSVRKTKRLSVCVCVCSMLYCNKVCVSVCVCVLSPSDLYSLLSHPWHTTQPTAQKDV